MPQPRYRIADGLRRYPVILEPTSKRARGRIVWAWSPGMAKYLLKLLNQAQPPTKRKG